jgi:hypothetical protein
VEGEAKTRQYANAAISSYSYSWDDDEIRRAQTFVRPSDDLVLVNVNADSKGKGGLDKKRWPQTGRRR